MVCETPPAAARLPLFADGLRAVSGTFIMAGSAGRTNTLVPAVLNSQKMNGKNSAVG
jgi:hypothetical protein